MTSGLDREHSIGEVGKFLSQHHVSVTSEQIGMVFATIQDSIRQPQVPPTRESIVIIEAGNGEVNGTSRSHKNIEWSFSNVAKLVASGVLTIAGISCTWLLCTAATIWIFYELKQQVERSMSLQQAAVLYAIWVCYGKGLPLTIEVISNQAEKLRKETSVELSDSDIKTALLQLCNTGVLERGDEHFSLVETVIVK